MIAITIAFPVADLFFLDSNVLIYAISKHQSDVHKNAVANRILQEDKIAISTQVMQEFFVNATVKGGMADREAREWLDALVEFPCIHTTRDLVFSAIDHAMRYMINYYDAAIIAAAEQAGAQTVYTEDLNHGQKYGRVTVFNPFKEIAH
jgi:predicted nucleic acid-binding protein